MPRRVPTAAGRGSSRACPTWRQRAGPFSRRSGVRYLPDLVDRVLAGAIDPGKVFDLTLPLDQVAEGYRAMDERRAVKTLLKP